MPKVFKRGDHVQWNSEAGLVRGVIIKKVTPILSSKGMCTMLPKTTRSI